MSSLLISKNFKILAFFCDCTSLFVLDPVGNPGPVFSRRGSYEMGLQCPDSLERLEKPGSNSHGLVFKVSGLASEL